MDQCRQLKWGVSIDHSAKPQIKRDWIYYLIGLIKTSHWENVWQYVDITSVLTPNRSTSTSLPCSLCHPAFNLQILRPAQLESKKILTVDLRVFFFCNIRMKLQSSCSHSRDVDVAHSWCFVQFQMWRRVDTGLFLYIQLQDDSLPVESL